MRLSLDTNKTTIFVGTDATAQPHMNWVNGAIEGQMTDPKNPSLLAWKVKAELCVEGESPEQVVVKLYSATAPTIQSRTEYRIEGGSLFAVPYATATSKIGISITLTGKLVPVSKSSGRSE